MKKIFSTLLAVLCFSALMAQSTEVPSNVKITFKNKFKSTTVTWSTGPQSYIAKWDDNGKKMTAFYSKGDEPSLVRTETDVQLSELSTPVQTSVKERFQTNGSPYTFTRAFKVEGFGNVVEGCEFNVQNGSNTSKISIFYDAAGTMVKREMN